MQRLSATLSLPWLDMVALREITPEFERMPYAECRRCQCALVSASEGIAVTVDPFDLSTRAQLESRFGPLRWQLVYREDFSAWLVIHEESLSAIDGISTKSAATGDSEFTVEDVSLLSIAADNSPIVRLVNSTIYDAMKSGASDIHLEMHPGGLQIKYRIDGVLTPITAVTGIEASEQTVSRIKVMADVDITERRVPQDGRFRLSVRGRETDFRVSIMPGLHGEDVVIRILDKRALADHFQTLRMDLLGFDEGSMLAIRRMSREPHGMLLVTGPTGSGKTTTLYAAVSEISNGQDKIVTIEDPVEYQLPGILQIPVNERKGLTFARGLRSILRHDPDKILVGEIRDPETAQIAIQSALTGHLVFTSVHANNVFDVLGRFLHMGVDPYSFVSAVNGIVAQRLLRMNCPSCSIPVEYSEDELARSGISVDATRSMVLQRGRGCRDCRGTGYKGRAAIAEILHMDDELRELIASRAPIRAVKDAAIARGTRFLRQSAIDLLGNGRTTLDEVNRVSLSA
ncbi:GspE/PulE family protein [Sinimarinibacterium flocculans]|uniref:GspE/PulE family protein n=1 Tax=Sinimarinibacterium flocculans TaxID=985250 RepID=UPI00356602D1